MFWPQWLAGRNLGLVSVGDPASFAWPGYWIAGVIDSSGHEDAVLMFGVPSGPVLDPAGVHTEGSTIGGAIVVAPFDLDLGRALPYGSPPSAVGSVAALLLAPAAEATPTRVGEALAVAGRGLSGDRYEVGEGTFSGRGQGYQLTLIEAESLDALAAEGVTIAWEDARRNIVTRGVALNALVGHRFRIGPVECVGRRLAEPCAHLQRLAPAGVLRGLVHRGGLRADILVGGVVRVDDPVVPIPDE